MNKEAIQRTATCAFDPKDGTYTVESPLLAVCAGISDNKREAWKIFNELLDDLYVEYLEGRRVGNYHAAGRPPKGGVDTHLKLKPQTRQILKKGAEEIGCSQGEFVDFLAAFWRAELTRQPQLVNAPPRRAALRPAAKATSKRARA